MSLYNDSQIIVSGRSQNGRGMRYVANYDGKDLKEIGADSIPLNAND